jgi:hypothetical protein
MYFYTAARCEYYFVVLLAGKPAGDTLVFGATGVGDRRIFSGKSGEINMLSNL